MRGRQCAIAGCVIKSITELSMRATAHGIRSAGARKPAAASLNGAPPRVHVTPGYQACTFILPDR